MLQKSHRFSARKTINPASLLRLLIGVAIISILLIIILTAGGIHRVYSHHILKGAEEDAVQISQVILSQEREILFSASADTRAAISLQDQAIGGIDERMRVFLAPFDIVKIKMFTPEGDIIYSTDANIIGKKVENNPRLTNALSGNIDSKMETKENLQDLKEEERFDVDVVETYVPIRDPQGRIAGSFELYMDVTHYRREIMSGVTTTTAILAAILLGVFAFSFIIVKKSTDQLAEAQQRLRSQAATDPLTGLFNRGAILHRAEAELSRMTRKGEGYQGNSLGLIMLDIDYFKKINDTYGHHTGDEVLRELSRRITHSIRKHDIFGRYGGEEFLAVIPDASMEMIEQLAEKLRRELRETPFSTEEGSISVTASFGIALAGASGPGFEEALKLADQGLYAAKNSGRDRIGCVPEARPPEKKTARVIPLRKDAPRNV